MAVKKRTFIKYATPRCDKPETRRVALSASSKEKRHVGTLLSAIAKTFVKNGIEIINGKKQAHLASGVFPFVSRLHAAPKGETTGSSARKRLFTVARFVRGRRENRAIIKTLNLTSSWYRTSLNLYRRRRLPRPQKKGAT